MFCTSQGGASVYFGDMGPATHESVGYAVVCWLRASNWASSAAELEAIAARLDWYATGPMSSGNSMLLIDVDAKEMSAKV